MRGVRLPHPLPELIMPLASARHRLTVALCSTVFAAHAAHALSTDIQLSVVARGGNSAVVSIKFDGIEGEIMSPRDAASGLATGKRQHKPIAAKTPIGVLEEFQLIVANPPAARTSTVFVTLSMEGGGTCNARVPATYDASTKRIEVALGDAARFFDAAKRPRPDLCPAR